MIWFVLILLVILIVRVIIWSSRPTITIRSFYEKLVSIDKKLDSISKDKK